MDLWGNWMRVTVVTDRQAGSGAPRHKHDELIQLTHVARVKPFFHGTMLVMGDGDVAEITEDFEVMVMAMMLAQGPRPPMTREEVARELSLIGDHDD